MNPLSELDFIKIGEITKAHGYKGDIVIKLSEDFENLKKTELLFFEIEGNKIPFFFEKNPKKYKQSGILAKFENIDNEKHVEELLQADVFTTSDNLIIEEEEDIVSSLSGYQVYNKDLYIGIAGDYFDIPSNPILTVISESEKEILIPLQDKFLIQIDETDKKVIFSLPEGLIDINE
jgi:16S rRNA processing protein RimM